MLQRNAPRLAAVVSLFIAATAQASIHHLELEWNNGYHIGNAGEINVTLLDKAWDSVADGGLGLEDYDLSHYSDLTATYGPDDRLQTFASFCVEKGQTVHFDTKYVYDGISSAVVPGGAAGPSLISVGTAYLYEHFAKGILDGYDYTPATRDASAANLQKTIWFLEGQQSKPSGSPFLALLEDEFGSLALAKADYHGDAVSVLNDHKVQDQLIMTGSSPVVPEPASLIVWGSLAAAGGYCLRRRMRRRKQQQSSSAEPADENRM